MMMRYILCLLLLTGLGARAATFRAAAHPSPAKEYYYQLRVYHLKTAQQMQVLDNFLQAALLPALHRAGIKTVGVFKPVETDTADLRVYVFIPFETIDRFLGLDAVLKKDAVYSASGSGYLEATYNEPPYTRMESILLRAFKDMPAPAVPDLQAPKKDRVYELRSYESPTEGYHENKVHMFNEGGEVTLFKKLGFNAVFYSDVVSGSHMPNLMYMTTFNSRADREAHWKTFSNDPYWKDISTRAEYLHNVSKADITFLYPTDYSDF
jgi:hypothetical protein